MPWYRVSSTYGEPLELIADSPREAAEAWVEIDDQASETVTATAEVTVVAPDGSADRVKVTSDTIVTYMGEVL